MANRERVREILQKFDLKDVEFQFDEKGYLEVVGTKNAGAEDWPQAVPVSELPRKEDYPDEEEYQEAVYDVYDDEGGDGFIALLKELTSCIEAPLTILAVSADSHWSESCVWRIEPGSQHVEVLDAAAFDGPVW
jgi:hypothetical protein